ncbi:MAG: aminotransferase, partial [Flavobacteriaceae bacterium]|nr:aminotransferase [Flavobacteriaceae bacterium]
MNKREFIKKISFATLAAPLFGSVLTSCVEEVADVPVKELASNGDFWLKVRNDYVLKPEYINLESGYYNIIPTPTLNSMIAHAKMVNKEGSYYMRTVQWDNKKRMAEKLSKVVGCNAKNLIITRNTTEALDLVIKGFPWKKGDEAVFAKQDYGAMKVM